MYIYPVLISIAVALIEFFGRGQMIVIISYGLINPILLFIPRISLVVSHSIRHAVDGGELRRIETLMFLVLVLNAPGSLILHAMGIQYDRLLHLMMGAITPVLFMAILIPLLEIAGVTITKVKTLIFVCVFIAVGLFVWEGYQLTIDKVFGTKLFSDVAQTIESDFWEDIIYGLAGLIGGMIYLNRSFHKFHQDHI